MPTLVQRYTGTNYTATGTTVTATGVSLSAGQIAIVKLGWRRNATQTVNGIPIFAGSSAGVAAVADVPNASGSAEAAAWVITGRTGTGDVVAALSANSAVMSLIVEVYAGADTTTPIGDVKNATGSTPAPSVNVTADATDLVTDVLVQRNGDTMTPGAGQSNAAALGVAQSTQMRVSTKPGAGGSTAIGWSGNTSGDAWVIVGIVVKAAPSVDTTLAGAALGAAVLIGALSTAITLAGAAAGAAVLAGALEVTPTTFAGTAAGAASASGALSTAVTLAGAASGAASASGVLGDATSFAGVAVGSATATGALSTAVELAGAATGSSAATGALATAVELQGAATGAATLTGTLSSSGAPPGLAHWPSTMDAVSLVELIETQVIGWLRDDARLTSLVHGRIWTAIPAGAPYPFVLVEGFVVSPWNRLRGFGRSVSFQARAQSQVKGDYEVHRIADRIVEILEGRDVALPPAKRALYAIDETPGATYTDLAAGVVTYHRPVIVRVRVQV